MKLHLRDLFWLLLVVAVGTLWCLDRSQLTGRLSVTPQPTGLRILLPHPKAVPTGKTLQQLQDEWEREFFDAPSHLEPRRMHGGVI